MNICLVKDGNHLEDCAMMNKDINDDQSVFLFSSMQGILAFLILILVSSLVGLYFFACCATITKQVLRKER